MLTRSVFLAQVAVAVAAVSCPGTLVAQWSSDPATNLIVSGAVGDQTEVTAAPDGQGGTIVVWTDARGGAMTDVYAQRLDAAGFARWTVGGTAVCTAADIQRAPAVVPDGAGGAIVTWYDARAGAGQIYAQRLDHAGNALWSPGGIAVGAAPAIQWDPAIAADGSGGAVIAWYEARSDSSTDIFAQRLDGAGSVLWPSYGAPVCTAAGGQVEPMIVADGAGGGVIVWTDFRNGAFQSYAQRMTAAGSALWQPNGVAICPLSDFQYEPAVLPDASGGIIVTWHDFRTSLVADIYAQRLSPAGTRLWPDAGVIVCSSAGDQYNPSIAADRAGGAYIAWHDFRGGTNADVYVQRLDAGGTPLLSPGGLRISGAPNNQRFTSSIADGIGGVLVIWEDRRNGRDNDVYIQHLEGDGSISFVPDGRPLCTAVNDQGPLAVVSTGAGGVISAWSDGRAGTGTDIAADRAVIQNRRSILGLWLGAWSGLSAAPPFFAGASPGSIAGVDPSDLPLEPGVPAEPLSVSTFLGSGAGATEYRQDMRPAGASFGTGAERWEVTVAGPAGSTITIASAEDRVPRGFRPVLYSDTSWMPQDLRIDPAYTFTAPGTDTRFTVLLGDSTPPSVALVAPNGGENLLVGVQTGVTWAAADSTGLLKYYLYFSETGADPYTLLDSVAGSATTYLWTPQSAAVNARIRIVAIDSVLNAATDSSDGTFTVVAGDSVALTPSSQYNLLSVPLLQADMSPRGIFEDDLGFPPFFIYTFNGSVYTTPDTLRLADGFWFLTGSETPVDAVGSVQPLVTIALRPGWNLTGNPFPVPVSRSNLRFARGGPPVGFNQAVVNGWIAGALYGYDSNGYFDETNALAVWNGYWILAAADSLTLTYDVSLGKEGPADEIEQIPALMVSASFVCAGGTATDRIAELCFGGDSRSLRSIPRPPKVPGGASVEVEFLADGDETPERERFARLHTAAGAREWRMDVRCPGPGRTELTWDSDRISALFSGGGLALHDLSSGARVEMQSASRYAYEHAGGVAQFRLVRTESAPREIPTVLTLEQNYPNPFNPATVIRFHLPSDGHVDLRVFDLLGREVVTLLDEPRKAGAYDVRFDGSGLGSGTYIYRLAFDGSTVSRKLLLMK